MCHEGSSRLGNFTFGCDGRPRIPWQAAVIVVLRSHEQTNLARRVSPRAYSIGTSGELRETGETDWTNPVSKVRYRMLAW